MVDINCTYLKCTIWYIYQNMYLIYIYIYICSQDNEPVTTKVTLCPFVALLSPFPCHAFLLSYPCPQVSTDLLSLIMDYFLEFYINVLFSVQLLSLSTTPWKLMCVVTYIKSFIFINEWSSIIWIYYSFLSTQLLLYT